MSMIRRLADFVAGKQRPMEPTPDITVRNQPGAYGLRQPDSRPNGSGLLGQSDVKFSAGEDFQLSRKPTPPIHDTRGNPAGSTASARDSSKDLPYGERVAPPRSNEGWASDSAHVPSKANDGKVRR